MLTKLTLKFLTRKKNRKCSKVSRKKSPLFSCRIVELKHSCMNNTGYFPVLLLSSQSSTNILSSLLFYQVRKLKQNPNTLMKTDQAFHFITSFIDGVPLLLASIPPFTPLTHSILSISPLCVVKVNTKNQEIF
jgi:hypothetical protein